MSTHSPLAYKIYRIVTHLLIPFATIPVGILFFYFSTATLPDIDVYIIFRGNSDFGPAITTAFIIAPIYYIHCIFNRSELSKQWQFGIHQVFILLTIVWMFYLCYRTESHFGTWTEESGRLDPFFLFTIPQIIATHVFHWFWVQKYRKPLYLRWFKGIKPKKKGVPNISATAANILNSNQPTQPKPIKTREEAQREFNESLEQASIEENQNKEWLNKLLNFDMPPMLPSFKGKKIWETVIFKQNIDDIAYHRQTAVKSLIAYNYPNKFCIIDSTTGQIIEQIETNFNESWDDNQKTFIELSEVAKALITTHPLIKNGYWRYIHNGRVHSSFDPYAHYDDGSGSLRLRKTVHFKSILSKDKTLIAYINKGKDYAFVKIYRMQDHSHVQTIHTEVSGTHDCAFVRNNTQLIVGCDDGTIKLFDIKTGEKIHQLPVKHSDSVLCLDVNASETELISGSADGIWKIWSIEPGETFGECLHTSEQFHTQYNKAIPIYHALFSQDDTHIFIVTDIGRIRIYHRETFELQTNIYDKYQRHSASSKESTLLSIMVDSEEKCFYVGYANGKMQKWV